MSDCFTNIISVLLMLFASLIYLYFSFWVFITVIIHIHFYKIKIFQPFLESEDNKFDYLLKFFPNRKWANFLPFSILSVVLFMIIRNFCFNLDRKNTLNVKIGSNNDLIKDKTK